MSWLTIEGDGSTEFLSRCTGIELALLLTSLFGLACYIPPFLWWSWVWLEPVATVLFLMPILPLVLLHWTIRNVVHVSATARSLDSRLTFLGRTLRRKPGLLLADDAVEVVLKADDADQDELDRIRRERARGVKTKQRSIHYTVSLIDADETCTPIFTRRSDREEEVVSVAERIGAILGCRLRRLYRGQHLTPQQIRSIVGSWQTKRPAAL